ncbi:MAG: HAD-IA family hydrolase [Pseudomonadota bacterium]|nr:HAD-IA family hydrolase [Pseudomonadota bacterium]
MLLSAVLFDVDGTIAETEDFHRKSFNESFREFNLDWFWDEAIYKELINIGGGKERIEHYIKRAWPEMLDYKNLTKYINSIHKVKNEVFEDYILESEIKPRPGVIRLIKELKENNIRIAIVSSNSEKSLHTLFKKGLNINPKKTFDLIAHGECTKNKRPSPEIYEWVLEKLRLPPQSCVAIEDSPRGVESAKNANLNILATPSIFTKDEDFSDAKLIVSDLGEIDRPFNKIKGETFGNKIVNLDLLKKMINS